MDYLPAIQFAAALNIGYIIPNIMSKMNGVLNNINSGYVGILEDVRNKAIVKTKDINQINIVETSDRRTTRKYKEKLLDKLYALRLGCDEKETSIRGVIDGFINCSGYRSVFFYAALSSVLALLVIPFCYQHNDEWSFRLFLYSFNAFSLVYLILLFAIVIIKRRDMSCRKVLGFFILFITFSVLLVVIKGEIIPITQFIKKGESFFSYISIVISFLPGVCCMLFLIFLILYSSAVARLFAIRAWYQQKCISSSTKKLANLESLLEVDDEITII